MTSEMDMLYCTPTEYAPVLLLIGVIIAAVITLAKGLYECSEADKEAARKGAAKIGYGINYLSGNVTVIIFSAIMTLIIPGMYYSGAGAVPDEAGCYLIGLVVAVICAIGGDKVIRFLIEKRRNGAKATEARAETKE